MHKRIKQSDEVAIFRNFSTIAGKCIFTRSAGTSICCHMIVTKINSLLCLPHTVISKTQHYDHHCSFIYITAILYHHRAEFEVQ